MSLHNHFPPDCLQIIIQLQPRDDAYPAQVEMYHLVAHELISYVVPEYARLLSI